ncbi:phosphonopyruvate decarboxylase [Xanthomonas hyacinthi]|uniref:Phosphonopyruvate decarboxylase n=1 Tax=Xanthomonas hyacinthi TaxID=56455 RepID=A0A2S7EWL7_9XANT|nr:phosphonopyruvate decarboxylase [Xanthomonas hyacinthi]KLD73557.1 pyruvate decarboxylase [Xanthomonas hyacinthi DSM 19077]PPU97534.1 phosphonopyruvate decarboxylase [Xanthomonas hyacinthi]QGY77339.1 phosphonopyruvate decarboxylase [Xanthomonas hyacinthi]
MINGREFVATASRLGFNFYTSVPCSYLTSLLNGVLSDPDAPHVAAASEGEAIGIAAGAYLAGRLPVVMLQNSGLGNAVNPLTSLNHVFQIPCLLICSWRGCHGVADEPQHAVMGQITHSLLDVLRIPHARFPSEPDQVEPTLRAAYACIAQTHLPYALIVEPNVLEDEHLLAQTQIRPPAAATARFGGPECPLPSREDALRAVVAIASQDAAIIATTGKTGRELCCIRDDARNLYLVGSMGCASAVGLGASLNTEHPLIVLDGDGAALMKLGNLSTIGRYRPAGFIHVLLDNGVHDSTGGQPTNSGNIDFPSVAAACGYRATYACNGDAALRQALEIALHSIGPHFIHVRIRPGSMHPLPRPTVSPSEVGRRFAAHLRQPRMPQSEAATDPAVAYAEITERAPLP